jgi:hypothetical protein
MTSHPEWRQLTPLTGATSVDRPASAPPVMNMDGLNIPATGPLTPSQKVRLQAAMGTTPKSGPSGGDDRARGTCYRCNQEHFPYCRGSLPEKEGRPRNVKGECFVCHKVHTPFCIKKGDQKKGNARYTKAKAGGQADLNASVRDMADRAAGADIALTDFAKENAELRGELDIQGEHIEVLRTGISAADQIMKADKAIIAGFKEELDRATQVVTEDHARKDVLMTVTWSEDAPKAWWAALAVAAVPIAVLGMNIKTTYDLTQRPYGLYESNGGWKYLALCAAGVFAQTLAVATTNRLCALWGHRTPWGPRPEHTVTSVSQQESDTQDRRSDMMSLREMKHAQAKYQWFDFGFASGGVNLNRDKYGERTGKPVRALVSMELLRQITVPSAMLSRDLITLEARLEMIAKSTHTVNIDAELYKREGCDVVQNTIDLAVGLWEQHRQSRGRFA